MMTRRRNYQTQANAMRPKASLGWSLVQEYSFFTLSFTSLSRPSHLLTAMTIEPGPQAILAGAQVGQALGLQARQQAKGPDLLEDAALGQFANHAMVAGAGRHLVERRRLEGDGRREARLPVTVTGE